jgi:triphosphoribosyl-dephospho-CoA synthetase
MDRGRLAAAGLGNIPSLDEVTFSSRPLNFRSDDSLPDRATSKFATSQSAIAQYASEAMEAADGFAKLPTEVIELYVHRSPDAHLGY